MPDGEAPRLAVTRRPQCRGRRTASLKSRRARDCHALPKSHRRNEAPPWPTARGSTNSTARPALPTVGKACQAAISCRMRTLLMPLLVLALVACSTTDQSRTTTAVVTPLNDLNLVKGQIPEVLQDAQQAPYRLSTERTCGSLAHEIKALDDALGPDIDAPPSEASRGLLERGADEASDAAVGAVQRTAEGIIPFRGWVRKC